MRGKQRQWLLIKRDDAYAVDGEADDLVEPGAIRSRAKKADSKAGAKRSSRKADVRWRKRAQALDGLDQGEA